MHKTYRIFSLVAYDVSDTMSFSDIHSKLDSLNCTYFIIKHDKDNADIHYHISLYFQNPTTISVVSSKLGITPNYIKIQDDFGKRYTLKNTIGYLIHYNNKEKYNYKINDIITNDIDLVNKYYDLLTGGSSESQILKEILLFIDNNPYVNNKDLLVFCIDNDFLKTFRKYAYYLNQIIKENINERSRKW